MLAPEYVAILLNPSKIVYKVTQSALSEQRKEQSNLIVLYSVLHEYIIAATLVRCRPTIRQVAEMQHQSTAHLTEVRVPWQKDGNHPFPSLNSTSAAAACQSGCSNCYQAFEAPRQAW